MFMSRLYTVLFLLCAICSNIMAQVSLLPVSKKALYEKSSLYYTEFDKLTKERSLPIGVFDSGTGGFTVLERMLQQDRFNNKTGKEEPDGIADFSHEDFEYLADQANMPYGRYESENKGDYLRELAVKDALFLINGKYRLEYTDNRGFYYNVTLNKTSHVYIDTNGKVIYDYFFNGIYT